MRSCLNVLVNQDYSSISGFAAHANPSSRKDLRPSRPNLAWAPLLFGTKDSLFLETESGISSAHTVPLQEELPIQEDTTAPLRPRTSLGKKGLGGWGGQSRLILGVGGVMPGRDCGLWCSQSLLSP